MKICRLCQVEREDDKFHTIIAPDKNESFFCEECMNDFFKFLESGELEEKMLKKAGEVTDRLVKKINKDFYNTAISSYCTSTVGYVMTGRC